MYSYTYLALQLKFCLFLSNHKIYARFAIKMADSLQHIFSLTLLLGTHVPRMTSKEKSKLKKISLKKLNQHINLFHFGADIGQAHHMFSRFFNLRFFFHEIFFALFFFKVEFFCYDQKC